MFRFLLGALPPLVAASLAVALTPAVVAAAPSAGEVNTSRGELEARARPGSVLPDQLRSSSAALIFDLVRIVDAEESSGWLLDETAFSNIHPVLMESVCRASPEARMQALAEVEQSSRERGDARALFSADRQLTDRVQAALSAERRATALRESVRAAEDRCPFWLAPEASFRGRQSTRDRWILNFDTGGTAQIRRSSGDWTLGAGGFGRLLTGYTFGNVGLLAGIEFGGGALLEPDTQPTEFVVNYIPALPVLLRWQRGAWHFDFEAALVSLFQASNTDLSYGVRGGFTVGITSLRLRGVLPWVGLGVASEYHFENSARPEALYLRGGLRVGGVWAP